MSLRNALTYVSFTAVFFALAACGVKNDPQAPKTDPKAEEKTIDGIPMYKPDEGEVGSSELEKLSMLGNDYQSDDYRFSDTLIRRFETLYPEGVTRRGFQERPVGRL